MREQQTVPKCVFLPIAMASYEYSQEPAQHGVWYQGTMCVTIAVILSLEFLIFQKTLTNLEFSTIVKPSVPGNFYFIRLN